jgi:hypothetical protein
MHRIIRRVWRRDFLRASCRKRDGHLLAQPHAGSVAERFRLGFPRSALTIRASAGPLLSRTFAGGTGARTAGAPSPPTYAGLRGGARVAQNESPTFPAGLNISVPGWRLTQPRLRRPPLQQASIRVEAPWPEPPRSP